MRLATVTAGFLLLLGCGDDRLVPLPPEPGPDLARRQHQGFGEGATWSGQVAQFRAEPEPGPDAGVPSPVTVVAFTGPDGPPCCSPDGERVGSATCRDGVNCVCSSGDFCGCQGQSAGFLCTDVCGSDAWVDPGCTSSGWSCESGLVATNTCGSGTCWGEPGDCCIGPSCVDGRWECAGIADGC